MARAHPTPADALFTWVHLTDPAFGPAAAPGHTLRFDALARDLLAGPTAEQPRPRPRTVMITGDLAAVPSKAAYDNAFDTLSTLAKATAIEPNRIFAVPGDRDHAPPAGPLQWALASFRDGAPIDAALSDEATRAAFEARRAEFDRCAARLARCTRALWWANRLPAAAGLAVRLLGLDTALLATGAEDAKRLQLGSVPVSVVLDGREADEIIITLSHHPLTAEWLRDAVRAGPLTASAHLHLHGAVEAGSALVESGAGPRAIAVAARPFAADGPAGYTLGAVLRTADGRLVVRLWPRLVRQDGTFGHDSALLPDGRPFVEYALPTPRPIPKATPSAPRPVVEPVLDAYRRRLRAVHEQLAPLFRGSGHDLLREVFVQLDVTTERGDGAPEIDPVRRRSLTLEDLLCTGPRWAILGEPGAGKSTLARRLTWELAGRTERDAPIPVFVCLARLARENRDPFALAAADLESVDSDAAAGLVSLLRSHPERLWILLDGLDEVSGDAQPRIREAIAGLAAELPAARIAVFARPVGYHSPAACFRTARVRPLTDTQQRQLLTRWLVDPQRVERTLDEIARRPRLATGARNPLLLTLIAHVARDGGGVPRSRMRLFGKAIEVLLERGCTDEAGGVSQPDAARDVLAPLSFDLQAGGDEEWARPHIARRLRAVAGDPEIAAALKTCGGERRCLDEIAHASGILAPHDGPAAHWRYLHRSLRERLAAEALATNGEGTICARAEAVGDDREELGRWGVTLAMACALSPAPLPLLVRLRALSAPLALRVLPDIEGVEPQAALDFLVETPGWDGDDLLTLARDWPDAADAARRLMGLVQPESGLDRLAFVHYALEGIRAAPDRAVFFGAAGKPLPGSDFVLPMVDIAPGCFMMGSPADEQGRWDDEGPQHRVTLTSGFRLGTTPVTRAQYGAFDPAHACPGGPRHPVTEVSWWRARLFAAWAGCRLPTEAEWEYVCRAGAATRFWSGDGEADLARVGWYVGNSGGSTHPVGEKPANPWGLYDMHGNVDEWTADWHGVYVADAQTDPSGPPRGVDRVIRGGSFDDDARVARSAVRGWGHPADRDHWLGFRLAAPPQLDLYLDG